MERDEYDDDSIDEYPNERCDSCGERIRDEDGNLKGSPSLSSDGGVTCAQCSGKWTHYEVRQGDIRGFGFSREEDAKTFAKRAKEMIENLYREIAGDDAAAFTGGKSVFTIFKRETQKERGDKMIIKKGDKINKPQPVTCIQK